MKLCVSARQELPYIDWAEEIIFEYKDRKAIPDYIDKYPGKTIILQYFDMYDDFDWDEIKRYNALAMGNFILSINNLLFAEVCKAEEIKFYFAYPITSYDELTAALAMGSIYVRLGGPLFFDMDYIHQHFPEARIRIAPNIAYDDGYFRENGISGTWIRPEDIMMYAPYVEAIEFFNDADQKKEQALIRIYWTERKWLGKLNMIITNLGSEGINRMIPSDVTEHRLNCRQVCRARRACHICYRALSLANEDRVQAYKDTKDQGLLIQAEETTEE